MGMTSKRPAQSLLDTHPHFIVVVPSGCWIWIGATGKWGYGHVGRNGKTWRTHIREYEHRSGKVPCGLELDHLCRQRNCCNPDHLEAVTRRENLRRGDTFVARNLAKTRCKRGHTLSGENLFVDANGSRQCRKCIKIRRASSKLKA